MLFIFPDGVAMFYNSSFYLSIFYQTSYLSLVMIWDVTGGPGAGGLGAAWFGGTFNVFNLL